MILYFGNILSGSGNNPSFIELLGPRLATLTKVKMASRKKGMAARMLDMIRVFLTNRKEAEFTLIDTYSYLGFYYAVVIGFLCRRTSRRYVPIIRGGDFKRRFEIRPSVTRRLLSGAHAVVVPSGYLVDVLAKEGYHPMLIPNFVDVADYPFRLRTTIRPRLLWVRSFHAIYNPAAAIETLALLLKEFPAAQLCMVGPDKDGSMEVCRKYARDLHLEGAVEFTGKLTKEEWRRKSTDYDIFINTATIDNHPVSVMEAMLLGLPVVSTRVGGVPYLVAGGEEAILVEPGKPEAMTAAIRTLLNDPQLAATLQANARRKAESFDWPHIRDKWVNLLQLENAPV